MVASIYRVLYHENYLWTWWSIQIMLKYSTGTSSSHHYRIYKKKKWGKNLWKRSSLASRKPKQMRTKRQFQKKRGASPCNKQEQKSNKSRLGFEEGLKTDKHQSRCCCLDDDATDGESVSDKIRARQSTLGWFVLCFLY